MYDLVEIARSSLLQERHTSAIVAPHGVHNHRNKDKKGFSKQHNTARSATYLPPLAKRSKNTLA